MGRDRPPLGRWAWQGIGFGPTLRLPPGHSLLIVGPTQAGKTSSLVMPAVLRWRGAVVLTSVKHDVVAATSRWRATLGDVQRLEPGRADGLTWNPLEGVRDLRHALRVAHSLTTSSTRGDSDFWNALATKLVGALLMDAHVRGRSIFDVTRDVESRAWLGWSAGLASSPERDLLVSFRDYDVKTLDGVVTTAETMLMPWRFEQPLARVRAVVEGANTLYLCSPRNEQSSYEPLFRGALRMVLEEQQRRFDDGVATPLLLVLDEAANVASLDELDQMASTVAGLHVTLVTVVQDFAQLQARWGQRAATIVNNHATRLVLGGLADPAVGTYLPELTTPPSPERAVIPLRRRPVGTAMVVSGRRAVFTVRMRPWWRSRRLRQRGDRGGSLRSLRDHPS